MRLARPKLSENSELVQVCINFLFGQNKPKPKLSRTIRMHRMHCDVYININIINIRILIQVARDKEIKKSCKDTLYLVTNADHLGQGIASLQWRAKRRGSRSRVAGGFPRLEGNQLEKRKYVKMID